MEPPPRPDRSMPPGGPVPSRPRSGRGPVLVVAILLLAVALVIFLMRSGSDGFPDSVLGYERLHNEDAERAERAIEDIKIGDVEIRGAVYGSGDEPQLFAALYENYPAGLDAEAIVQGAAGGAPDPADCNDPWSTSPPEASVGVVVTTHTGNPTLGLEDVRAFVEALEAT